MDGFTASPGLTLVRRPIAENDPGADSQSQSQSQP